MSIQSSTYKHLTNDFKEDLLGTENVAAKDFINALSESKGPWLEEEDD